MSKHSSKHSEPNITLKKKLTVDIAVVCVTVLLCVSALLWPFDLSKPKIKVGAGSGTNTEVTEVEQVADVIEFIELYFSEGLSGTDDPHSGRQEDLLNTRHTGVTMEIKDAITMTEISQSVAYEIHSDWKLYLTTDASYYDEAIELLVADSQDSLYICADIEAYATQNKVLYKFDAYEYTERVGGQVVANLILKEEYKGKWIEFSDPKIFETDIKIDTQNRDILTQWFEEIKGSGEEGGAFKVNDNIYTKEISDIGMQQKLMIDLSDADNPTMVNEINMKYTDGQPISGIQEVSFKNIDNTVLDIEITPEYVITTESEMLNMFHISQ